MKGTVYMPTGVCGETCTLNNGGWILWMDTRKPLELKTELTLLLLPLLLLKVILVTLLEKVEKISAGISCCSPCLTIMLLGDVDIFRVEGGMAT